MIFRRLWRAIAGERLVIFSFRDVHKSISARRVTTSPGNPRIKLTLAQGPQQSSIALTPHDFTRFIWIMEQIFSGEASGVQTFPHLANAFRKLMVETTGATETRRVLLAMGGGDEGFTMFATAALHQQLADFSRVYRVRSPFWL